MACHLKFPIIFQNINHIFPGINFDLIYLAEFGDHDPERHTLQYLKEFVLVPKVS